MNALPFVAMAINCLSWVFYGAVTADWFVYVSNIPGVLCGLLYSLVCEFLFSCAGATRVCACARGL